MNGAAARHPVLGPGFAGLGAWAGTLGLLGAAGALGLGLTYSDPVLVLGGVLALAAVTAFLVAGLAHPVGTLCFVVCCQILMPVYIRPAGVPPPLLMLTLLCALAFARRMLDPEPTRHGRQENLIATSLLIYNAALLLTIPNENATTGSYLMLIKTIVIPTALFFVVLGTLRGPGQVATLFKTITFAATLCGLLGLHEFVTRSNIVADLLAPEVSYEEDVFLWLLVSGQEAGAYLPGMVYRVYSFFTQPLEYSAFMIMAFPYPALRLATAARMSERIVYGLATLIILCGFLVSFSRGPTLALGLVILYLGLYERRVRPWILGGLLVLAAGVAVTFERIVDTVGERVTASENITLRFSLWKNGIEIFAQNPLRGIGYGSYPNYHVESLRVNRIGPLYEYGWAQVERVTTVENIYVSLAAETGLLGLSAFALVIGVSFATVRRLLRHCTDDPTRVLALSASGAGLAFLLSGMTVANIIGYTISILFFGVYVAAITVLSRQLPDSGMPLVLVGRAPGTPGPGTGPGIGPGIGPG